MIFNLCLFNNSCLLSQILQIYIAYNNKQILLITSQVQMDEFHNLQTILHQFI